MDVAQTEKIINQIEPGWVLVAVAVPTRALRLIRDDMAIKFRVEQLDVTANFTWRPVSTHAGDEAWESHKPAIVDMVTKQSRLREKIKLAKHEQRMAMIKAENPLAH